MALFFSDPRQEDQVKRDRLWPAEQWMADDCFFLLFEFE
jgi:hypothetical protein